MKISKIYVTAVFLFLICFCLSAIERKVIISENSEKINEIEIVKANKIPLVDYAAKELQTFLKQATGKTPKIVDNPTPGIFSIILGECALSQKAGADLTKLPAEGFYILRKENHLFIVGKDSLTESPAKGGFNVEFPRGTLTGTYDFLERFAGIRFFFPGRYGTIVPKRNALYLPSKICIIDFPDMYSRRLSLYGNAIRFYENFQIKSFRAVYLPRMRESEKRINFDHGLNGLEYIRRFGKTHPEYFSLLNDGSRHNDPQKPHPGQLCFSSNIREEIYQDIKAYFTGQPASIRGLKEWPHLTVTDGVFGVMPQDGMLWCRCEKCSKIWPTDGRERDPRMFRATSDFLFSFYADLSHRLTKEGIQHKLATMAYYPATLPPTFTLPKDLLVQVAVNGRGGNGNDDQRDTQLLKDWYEKTGNKITAWTYAMGKHMNKAIPGIPAMMPRHAANFIKNNSKYLAGVYFGAATDYFLFNYLNYYITQKLMWNSSLDPEELLADHFKTMFGKGAPFMEKFYADLEENWSEKILGKTVETSLGPVSVIPSAREIWEEIYSPAKIKYYNRLFDQAVASTKGDNGITARLNFIRKELLGPIENTATRYHQMQKGLDFWIVRCPGSIWLRPFTGEINEVNTKLTLHCDGDNLIVRADCEEPCMKNLKADCLKRDDPNIVKDSEIGIMLNPSGDRKNYYQFDINANGALSDYRISEGKHDLQWNSSASAKAGKGINSWWVEVKIPLQEIGSNGKGAFPVNFVRNRALKGCKVKNPYYMWSIYPGTTARGFHATETWGKLSFEKPEKALIINSNLEILNPKNGKPQHWSYTSKNGVKFELDDKVFISGGHSIRVEIDGTRNASIGYRNLPVKPNHKYRLSYFLKTENLTGKDGAGAWIYFFNKRGGGMQLPLERIKGTNPWHRISCEFTAPARTGEDGYAPVLGLWVWNAKGKVWFDEIHLEEMK